MPQSQLKLKSTVTRRTPTAVNPDLKARLAELQHHQAAEATAFNADPSNRPVIRREPENPPEQNPEPSGKQLKREAQREAHALQSAFLSACLNKPVLVYLINGIKLVGRVRQFDQYCLLLEGSDGVNSLIFKHAISTLAPAAGQ